MATVSFVKNIAPVEVEPVETLMEALLKAGLPVASSCKGDGICAKCRVRVVAGAENLSPMEPLERRVRERLRLAPDLRLSCQTRVVGPVTVDTTYW